jgi:hypothetical protein
MIAIGLFLICAPFLWIALGLVELQIHDVVILFWTITAACFAVIASYLMKLWSASSDIEET